MITKLTRHDSHDVKIHKTKPGSKHYAALRCVECNTHIQWLSFSDFIELHRHGSDLDTLKDTSYD